MHAFIAPLAVNKATRMSSPTKMPPMLEKKSLVAAMAGFRSWYRNDRFHKIPNCTIHLQVQCVGRPPFLLLTVNVLSASFLYRGQKLVGSTQRLLLDACTVEKAHDLAYKLPPWTAISIGRSASFPGPESLKSLLDLTRTPSASLGSLQFKQSRLL